MKETFIVRTEWVETILKLPAEEQLIMWQNILYYHTDRENLINLNNLQVSLVWGLIVTSLKRHVDEYDKRKETSKQNGLKGGRPRKQIIETEDGTNEAPQIANNLNNLIKPNDKPNNLNKPCIVYDYVNDIVDSTCISSTNLELKSNNLPTEKISVGLFPETIVKQEKKENIWQLSVGAWKDFYKSKFVEEETGLPKEPSFDAVHGDQLKKIIARIQRRVKAKGKEWTGDFAVECLTAFFNRAYKKDQWLREHFELKNILQNYDSIYNDTKNKEDANTKANFRSPNLKVGRTNNFTKG